ncbi:MAG: PH domain-containing protein [Deferribacteres bacterium]|nr:PH domain-containing protein [candidate division KSB1 bacterium]MCB9501726.1 PH domain-containing protein [Deferribacteres bacterium]
MKVFKSKTDTWLFLVIFAVIVASCAAALQLLHKSVSLENLLSALVVITIGAALPLWLFLSTRYVVTAKELLIQCGPLQWKIAIEHISVIRETRNPLGSPALSLDRLLICYENGKEIMISPRDKNAFINALGRNDLDPI